MAGRGGLSDKIAVHVRKPSWLELLANERLTQVNWHGPIRHTQEWAQ